MNRNTLISLTAFAIGAAVGSVATWAVVKTKYERIAQEEIDSVKEVFSRRAEEIEESEDEEEPTVEEEHNEVKKAEVLSYRDTVSSMNYTNYTKTEDEVNKIIKEKVDDIVKECNDIVNKREEEEIMNDKPYVIPPDELGDDYDVVTLVYYADGVLTEYDTGEIVDDVEDTVGKDSLTRFGEYEDDSVFVRNDERGIDYEILRDEDKYSDTFDE